MAVSRMQKVQIFAHNSHRASLIKDLQDLEIIHINNLNEQRESTDEISTESESKTITRNIQNDLSNLQSAIDYLADFEPKKSFIAGFLTSRHVLSSQEYTDIGNEIVHYKWKRICAECADMEDQLTKLASRESRLLAERENLSFWSDLDAPIEEIRDTEKTAVRIGIIPVDAYDNLLAEVKDSNVDIVFEVIGRTRTDVNLVVIFLKADEQDASSILTKYGFSSVSLPIISGRVTDQLKRIDEETSEISIQRKEIAEKSAQLATHRTTLMAFHDSLTDILHREQIRESFAHTDFTFMVDGWVREKNIKLLREELSEKYDKTEIAVSEPSEGEEPPVDLKNGKLSSPFEMVTRLYSIPRYREIDPTPLLAPFQALGFAICLTDAGYGVVLSLVFLIVLLATRRKSMGSINLFKVLLISGLTTVLVGSLTGGWFGITEDKLPSFLLKMRVLDPNTPTGQLIFIGLIILFGYIEVLFGFAVKMYIYLKEGDWIGAFCVQLPWVLVMLLTPVCILLWRMETPSIAIRIVLAVMGLCAFLLVLFVGRENKNPAARVGMGLFGLYGNVTGTFGDTLSYMRLFALGLATGIIASSVNAIAGLVWGSSVVSKVGAVAILLFGHPFNIAINSLGGFIHSMRLQFVEFFTKFYEGGGREFQPFRKEHIYVTVLDLEKTGM